jgi:hypothetical protein
MTKPLNKINLPAAPTAQVEKLTRLRAARGQVAELCPEGVAFKELGGITCSIKTGLNPRQNFIGVGIRFTVHGIQYTVKNKFEI